MERIIKRSELQSDDEHSSSSESPAAREILKNADVDFVEADANGSNAIGQDQVHSDDDGEHEFRLFGAKRNENGASVHKVRLQSPQLSKGAPGFIQPERSARYYFSTPLSSPEKRQLECTALTSEQVLAQSLIPWPGSSYSWKVLHIPLSSGVKLLPAKQTKSFSNFTDDDSRNKRRRHGKKYRIRLRRKLAMQQAQLKARTADVKMKDAADREKRTRRNREKKVKKKLRDKAKKVAASSITSDVE